MQESRRTRFDREKAFLKGLPIRPFDVRETVPLVVGRDSTIRYETNRYSVPPHCIGATVRLLVHPLHRTVELLGPENLVRRFELAPAQSHTTIFLPEDKAEIFARWQRDRSRVQRWRSPPKKKPMPYIDVDIRSCAVYDAFAAANEEALV